MNFDPGMGVVCLDPSADGLGQSLIFPKNSDGQGVTALWWYIGALQEHHFYCPLMVECLYDLISQQHPSLAMFAITSSAEANGSDVTGCCSCVESGTEVLTSASAESPESNDTSEVDRS